MRVFVVAALINCFACAADAEILATSNNSTNAIRLEIEGHHSDVNCSLRLRTEKFGSAVSHNLKDTNFLCSVFGKPDIEVFGSLESDDALVALTFVRGGDGDHSNPSITLFGLNENGFRLLTQIDLYDVRYNVKNDILISIDGMKSFCLGPIFCDASRQLPYSILVPIRAVLGCDGLCVKTTLNALERENLKKTIYDVKKQAFAEFGEGEYETSVILSKESELLGFLKDH